LKERGEGLCWVEGTQRWQLWAVLWAGTAAGVLEAVQESSVSPQE